MKIAPAFVAFLLMSSPAGAGDFPAERIVAAAAGDWNGDGHADLAVIARPAADSDEDNGLYIYLTDPDEARLKLVVSAPDSVWGNLVMFGQEPAVTALASGSIRLTSQNSSIGRDRWHQALTIAYRDGQFLVAGYNYSSYDTLDNDNSTNCDLNLLTGKGTANGKPVAAKAARITLEAWRDAIGREACGLDAG